MSIPGKVVRVLPGMQSAFIDIGLERAAFLHVADIWEARSHDGAERHADADRKTAVRRPGADGAGDQGPDRHQGRAPVDADFDRRPHAGVPAARQAHRHLAKNRKGSRARTAAHAPAKPAAAGRKRRLHRAHHGRGSLRRGPGGRRRLPAQDLGRDRPRRAHPARHQPAVPGPEPGPARAARLRRTTKPPPSRSTRARTT